MVRIAGAINPSEKTVQTMLRVYPQERYTYTHKDLQIGQTEKRVTEEKGIALVFDGEIWNGKNLIDTYREHGLDFLKHIDGDFAFCLYDEEKDRIILGRDRIGKKPLYWYQDPNYFLFASEIKSLLVTGIVPQTPALDGLAHYFALGYFPQDITPIERVNKLHPGYYLLIEKDRSVHIRPFWSLSNFFAEEIHEPKEEIIDHLRHLVDQAVKKRLPKEGKIGCFVSGGIGSASVACLLGKHRPVVGLSCGYAGQNELDVTIAQEVCEGKVTWITPENLLDDMVTMLWHLDEPIADPNIVSIWNVAKSAEGIPTVFSGMGSDEILAGHNRYTIFERYVPPVSRMLGTIGVQLKKRMLIPLLHSIGSNEAFKLLKHSEVNPYLEQYVVQNQLFSFDHFKALSHKLYHLFDPDIFLQKFHNISRIPQIVSACAYLDMKTRLPDQFILEVERATSAFGLDWRAPYLDKDLIEYAATIPEPETEVSTYLKEMFSSSLHASVLDRQKRTRRNFLNSWVGSSDLKEIFPLLANGTLVNTGLISKRWVEKMCVSVETMENTFRYLFSVLILELWFKMYINKPLTFDAPKMSVKDLLLEI